MTKGNWWMAICLPLATMVASCFGQEASTPKAAVDHNVAAIAKVRNEYAAAWKTGIADRVAGLYADDGVVLYPNNPALVGKSAILRYFKTFFDQFVPTNFELASDEVTVAGDWAFDRGTYKLGIVPKGGAEAIHDYGKYLVILQRQADGSWKVARDMDNSDSPASYAGQQRTANP